MSTTNFPQINDLIERVNGILKQYLRGFINFRRNNWVDPFPFSEF